MEGDLDRRERLGRKMLERALSDERQEFGSFFLSRLLGLDRWRAFCLQE